MLTYLSETDSLVSQDFSGLLEPEITYSSFVFTSN